VTILASQGGRPIAETQPIQSTTHLWVESGETSQGPVAQVAITTPVDRLYSYVVPESFADGLRPGQRVIVPFGRKDRTVLGFCVAVSDEPWIGSLKPIHSIVDPAPILGESLLSLGTWISEYYACSLGLTLEAMVPEAVRRGAGTRAVRDVTLVPGSGPAADERVGPKHRALLDYLRDADGPVPVNEATQAVRCTEAVVRTAAARGHVEITPRRESVPGPNFDRPRDEPDYALNDEQTAAVDQLSAIIDAGDFTVALLHGVSGSGKTEVYIRAMRRVLSAGRQVILLVPEIALTTQTVHRLAARFDDVAVIHSGLTGAKRANTWSDIAAGRKRVIIGTRSAVFAPCPDLGLIVVDEEQEPSYKSPRSPRYHARDTAIKRGHLESFPVIVGSATPSLETWYNCRHLQHYTCIRLRRRVSGLAMPDVELIDMQVERRARPGMHLLSRRMEEELRATLNRGEQAVLLLNRRGYASYLFCPSCRTPITCPRCASNLVVHRVTGPDGRRSTERCVCHYCHSRTDVPIRCPDDTCGQTLARFGMGTQRVEEELRTKFPALRAARVDSDTMAREQDYRSVVADFEARKLDALIGTQMIAKGLDFPFVSFVGVLSVDTMLAIPDFRSAERTFQLVVQVAGRSGRAETAGKVIVQCFTLGSAALEAAVVQDYERFATGELTVRQETGLPPYTRLARIVLADPRPTHVRDEAVALAERIRNDMSGWEGHADCLGPQACPMARIRELYRFDLLLRAPSAATLQTVLQRLRADKILTARVKQLTVDVDPVSLL
jgi:primosomal protein N' (replication factor Y)